VDEDELEVGTTFLLGASARCSHNHMYPISSGRSQKDGKEMAATLDKTDSKLKEMATTLDKFGKNLRRRTSYCCC